jgi:hypothetical protein
MSIDPQMSMVTKHRPSGRQRAYRIVFLEFDHPVHEAQNLSQCIHVYRSTEVYGNQTETYLVTRVPLGLEF